MKRLFSILICVLLLVPFTFSCKTPEGQMNFNEMDVSKYVKLGDYKGMTVEVTKTEITEEDIQNEINALLESKKTYEKLTDKEIVIADGDIINIDFKGFMDGKQFDGGTATDVTVTMKNGDAEGYISGFGAPMIGAHVGDTVTAEVVFPEDYHQKDFASKPATFEITINYKCGEKILPEFNDAFIKEYTSGSYTTTEKYLKDLRKSLNDQLENLKLAAVWGKIIEGCEYKKVPEQEVNYVYNSYKEEIEYYAEMAGMSYESFLSTGYAYYYLGLNAKSDDDIKTIAREYVKEELAYFAVLQAEGLEVSDKDYDEYIAEIVDYFDGEKTEDEIKKEYTKEKVYDTLLKQKIGHEFVLENNTFIKTKAEDK